jgi:regulator of replication initiation timing
VQGDTSDTGIEQVNKALTQMDEVTQQNSALVEENAATAKTLEHQAKAMDEQVAFFQIDADQLARSEAHAAANVRQPASTEMKPDRTRRAEVQMARAAAA